VRREARLLVLLLLLPAAAAAQEAQVGSRPEPYGLLLGRACLDLDGDGRCSEAEPGVAGARARLSDGRVAVGDAAGRFHVSGLEGRVLAQDRSAYGAVEIWMEGTRARRVIELAPDGVAQVDLAAPPGALAAPEVALERVPPSGPALREGVLSWPVGGTVPAGARVRIGGAEAAVDPAGRFEGRVDLRRGASAVPVLAWSPSGAASAQVLPFQVAWPEGGAPRVYPGAPRPLATLEVAPGPSGALVTGRVAPGVRPRVAGLEVAPGPDGRFAAFVAGVSESVEVELVAEGARIVEAVPVPPGGRAVEGALLADLELSAGSGGARLAGHGAGSVAGSWREVRFQAGFDLDDRDRDADRLLGPRDALSAGPVPEPARLLAASGDGSVVEDAAAGRARLWARAEAPGVALALGSTRTGLGGDGVGRWERATFGARAAVEGRAGPVLLFADATGASGGDDAGGVPPPRAVHEELWATGGSLFLLSGRAIVAGSERVRAEWRDPASGLVTASRQLRRGQDYALDEATGRLLLSGPLPTVAAPAVLATGDPLAATEALLLVDYLDAGGPGAERLAGGRAGAALGPVRLELRAAAEDGSAERWSLGAAAASLDLGRALGVRVEAARSEGRLFEAGTAFLRTLDGGLSAAAAPPAEGGAAALHAEARGELAGAGWRAWWREREAGYSDGTWLEARPARERGAELAGPAGPLRLELSLSEREGTDERDPSGATPLEARQATGRAGWSGGPLSLVGELHHERWRQPAVGEQSAAGLRATWRAARGLSLDLSHLQAFAATGDVVEATFTGAGAVIDWGRGRLAARGGWGPELGPRLMLSGEQRREGEAVYGSLAADPAAPGRGASTGSTLGGRTHAGAVELFTEETVAEDRLGMRAGRSVGAAVEAAPGLRVSLSGERGERLRPGLPSRARGSATAGALYGRGALRASARLEAIDEAGEWRTLAAADGDLALRAPLTLSLRALLARGTAGGRRSDDLDAALGLAWRRDRATALLTVARVELERPDLARREAWLLSAAGTAALAARLRAGGQVRLALQQVGGEDADRLVASARLQVAVAGPVDLAAEYARRAALSGQAPGDQDSLRVEAGLAVGPGRLAAGYTAVGFTGDGVDPTETSSRGFLRVTLGL
jgi:hypothetical protein